MPKLTLNLDEVRVESMATTSAAPQAAAGGASGTYDMADACTRTCQEYCY